MTTNNGAKAGTATQALLDDAGFLREVVRTSSQPIPEEELTAYLGLSGTNGPTSAPGIGTAPSPGR